jgi:hypothetical protein
MHLNFTEIPLTYKIMTVPCYVVSEEGQLLLEGFIMELMNSYGHSVNIRSCLMFLVSLLKSFSFRHMTEAGLVKL